MGLEDYCFWSHGFGFPAKANERGLQGAGIQNYMFVISMRISCTDSSASCHSSSSKLIGDRHEQGGRVAQVKRGNPSSISRVSAVLLYPRKKKGKTTYDKYSKAVSAFERSGTYIVG